MQTRKTIQPEFNVILSFFKKKKLYLAILRLLVVLAQTRAEANRNIDNLSRFLNVVQEAQRVAHLEFQTQRCLKKPQAYPSHTVHLLEGQ